MIPVWQTPPGNLGTVAEGEFYQMQLSADNTTSFSHHNGVLPSGVRVTNQGIIEGLPKNYNYIQGVPTEVAVDVTSKFVVRATSSTGFVADRTFELTVTGQDAPIIESLPSSNLGYYFDGDFVEAQLIAFDPDPADTLTWKIQSGNLPDGLGLTDSGYLSGYIHPVLPATGLAGYDNNSFDSNSFDFNTASISRNYEFVVEVADGKDIAIKTYTIFVSSRNTTTADSDIYTADSDQSAVGITSKLTADQTALRNPYLVSKNVDFGTLKHDNYYSLELVGIDLDGDTLEYAIDTGDAVKFGTDPFDGLPFSSSTKTLPPGLVLNKDSGWLSGFIPPQAATKKEYNFFAYVYKKNNPTYISAKIGFSFIVVGDIETTVQWPESNLGTIETGDTSELSITATISDNRAVQYELKSGTFSKLPQGLRLTPDGLIAGRVSFECFMLDMGTTTFDKSTSFNETTIDREFKFTARVYSNDGVIDTYKEFKITILPLIFKPYENLYISAFPSTNQRNIYNNLVQNVDNIPIADLYRHSDANFGIQRNLKALVSAGLNPVTITDYIIAMQHNHYNNVLRIGDIKVAKVYTSDVLQYEVVYVELVDLRAGLDPVSGKLSGPADIIDLHTQQSVTPISSFTKPITVDAGWPKISEQEYNTNTLNYRYLYPNSIANMRNKMLEEIQPAVLERLVLPKWLRGTQQNPRDWILAAPIAYIKPGKGDKVAFLLKQQTDINLQLVSFEVDRFILGNNNSMYYNKTSNKWLRTDETTFDNTETTFDGHGTRFFHSIDLYSEPGENDIYLKFPRTNVFR